MAAMTIGEYPDGLRPDERIDAAVFASEVAFPRFEDVAPALGLNSLDLSGGAVVEDLDGDGFLDVLSSSWHTDGQLRFFRNQGDGTFAERTNEAGLTGIVGGLNLVQADYNNDGFVDVLVLRGAWLVGRSGQYPNSLLRNNGAGTFIDVTFRSGLGETHYPTQTAAWADYDLDGDLDLYVGNEALPDHPFPCQLFRNDGVGSFTDVAAEAGVQNLRYTKGVSWGDFDGDRYPDLYVSNLLGLNRLYRNRGDGTFEDVAGERRVAWPFNSFPTWFWDFDNDGSLDLFVGSYDQGQGASTAGGITEADYRLAPVVASYLGKPFQSELAKLYRGDGKGGFQNVAAERNLKRLTLPMGSNFGDLDNDGFPDFYLGTGYPFYDGLIPNVMYWNRGGRTFVDVTSAGGFGHLQKGHGVAFADLDNDGDQDVFEQMGGAYPGDVFGNALFENPGFGNHWLKVKLVGVESNRSAIGARIRLEFEEDGSRRSVYKHVNSGGSFGCNPLQQHLGVGQAETIDRLEVYWPKTDRTQTFRNLAVDRKVEIVEGVDELRLVPERAFKLGG